MSRRITVNAAARQSQNSTMALRLSVQRRSLPVESGRSAVLVLRPARFPDPLTAPGVRLSPHRALHVS
jgi:hypothetical protein